MNARSVARTWRLVRHLLPEQAWAQLGYLVNGRVDPVMLPGETPRLRVAQAASSFLPAPAHARGDVARLELINRAVEFGDRVDWDFTGEGLLWSYHLHQFDWLRQPQLSPALRTSQLLDWVARHPHGAGWRPHPISLRILSWGKLLLTPGALQPTDSDDQDGQQQSGELDASGSARGLQGSAGESIRHSLVCQAETLARNPERRLQANHLLSNWIGVVFAGLLFEGSRADAWLACEDRLRRELERQIGPDGSHVERSPMYHSLLLENLLDLLNLAQAVRCMPSTASPAVARASALAEELSAVTSRMLGALDLLTHPDGEIALFADSACGIAHPPSALRAYAASLGVKATPPRLRGLLADAGFARLEAGPFVLLASLAGPMPAYQPGHAHCDALAFELSVAGQRVITDTGVGEYTPGPDRSLCRATRSHATLEVAGQEQAEIWGAHRVGGRPEVVLHSADPPVSVEASCLGWAAGGVGHRRRFEVAAECVTIRDSLEGGELPVRIAFPLAPGLEPELGEQSGRAWARVPLPDGTVLELDLAAGDSSTAGSVRWTVERAPYFPEFGKRLERAVLVGVADAFTAGSWRFRLLDETVEGAGGVEPAEARKSV